MGKNNNDGIINDEAKETDGSSQPDILSDGTENDNAAPISKKKKKPWSTTKKVVLSVVAVFVAAVIGVGIWALTIVTDPMSQFQTVAEQMTPELTASQTQQPDDGTPVPTIDPKDVLASKADQGFLKNIVNVMLIGVDHSVERDTWGGKKAFHADVMIVLAINKETKEVSMISLPRDTYAKIPGVEGIYKLNASIDCGGGWPNDSGLQKVCEAAEWMLGGDIPVDYYYAVDMNAVKGLVDQIGGVDFDVDIDFKIQGRSYQKGMQHMDGQAVLDYLRVRKNLAKSEQGDLNRIDRQKRMLVAIYEKIKQNNLLTSIPDILAAFDGNLKTNVSFAQTAALALFAYDVPSENIKMYSMGGHYQNIFNWNFVLTDQKARVELIKKIYGIDVKQESKYTSKAANALWEKMRAEAIQEKAAPLLNKVKAALDADALLPPAPTPTPETPTPDPNATAPSTTSPVTESPAASPSQSSVVSPMFSFKTVSVENRVTTTALEGEYRKYGDDVWTLYHNTVALVDSLTTIESTDEKKAANDQAIANVQSLCGICSISPGKTWEKYWRINYETEDNEVKVDFN